MPGPDQRPMTDHADLIAKLENVTEGSREVDYRIAVAAGWQYVGDDKYKEWGCGWLEPGEDCGWQLPFFSTSLDAKLSWEDIVSVQERSLASPARKWFAVQRNSQRAGIAHTEVLARRIAALRHWKRGKYVR